MANASQRTIFNDAYPGLRTESHVRLLVVVAWLVVFALHLLASVVVQIVLVAVSGCAERERGRQMVSRSRKHLEGSVVDSRRTSRGQIAERFSHHQSTSKQLIASDRNEMIEIPKKLESIELADHRSPIRLITSR